MPHLSLDTEIQYVKGVGPRWANLFRKAGYAVAGDLLLGLPRRYEDRSNLPPISSLYGGESVTIRGMVRRVESRPLRGGKVIIRAIVSDGTGAISLTWFNQPWMKQKLQAIEGEILAYGTVKMTSNGPELGSPDFEEIEGGDSASSFARIVPVYALTEGLPQAVVRRAASELSTALAGEASEPLPHEFRNSRGLPSLADCIRQIHAPESLEAAEKARRRLVFEEFLYLQIALAQRRKAIHQENGIAFPIDALIEGRPVSADAPSPAQGNVRENYIAEENLFAEGVREQLGDDPLWDQIHRLLPFELTGAQRRVIGEIWSDMALPNPMNRLVQGDVGSGKTAVAASAMLAAVRSGYQAALMAPTEILAEQHYFNLKRLFDPVGIEVVLMAGKLTAKQKRDARAAAASGVAKIAVGTHALIADAVEFKRLGFIVIDEQHRFGVMQRAALRDKSDEFPDVLVMTATPIPRTISQTVFGDLDVSIIDELPPGRRPIITHVRPIRDRAKVYEGVRKLLEQGRQAYFVCPLVSESEMMMAQAAEELYRSLKEETYPSYKIGLIHGKMPTAEKESVMEAFRQNELQVLVSTTVIEVGVDVPNATIMVIEDANRFGLAQLHQLRGRVGRGSTQSYCVLIGDGGEGVAQERLDVMAETTDGFKISERDLEIRGAGNLAGTEQSGFCTFQYGDLVHDAILLSKARQAAFEIVENDPELSSPEWEMVRDRVVDRRTMAAIATVS